MLMHCGTILYKQILRVHTLLIITTIIKCKIIVPHNSNAIAGALHKSVTKQQLHIFRSMEDKTEETVQFCDGDEIHITKEIV